MNVDEIVYNKIIDGINYLALEKYEKAISCFEDVLKLDNGNLAALNNKAISLNGLNKFNDAILIFDEVLNIEPTFIFSLIGKGESLFNLKYYDSAILYFDRALNFNADNDYVLLDKANVYVICEQFDEALNCLNEVKRISGYSFLDRNFYSRISSLSKKEGFNKRLAFINKIEKHINLNEFENVYLISEDALNYDGCSLYFLFNKAYSAYMLGNYDESLSILNNILKIDFMNIGALDIKSRIFIKLKRYPDALDCLNDIKRFGGSVDSSLYKDISLKANLYYNEVSDDVKQFIVAGNNLISHNDFEGALNYYDLAININSSSVIALNNKAYALYLMNNYFDAVNTFNLALKIESDYVYSIVGKSYSLYFLNHFKDSLDCFKKAIGLDDSIYDQDFIDLLNKKIRGF